jgi:threonylcarbamoyladenosine tRNA methylthiotransferase MtaB
LRLSDLLQSILDQTAIRQLRISSVEPMDWSGELMELVAREERIAKHVHLPLQSGSDAVLKRMFRKYRTRHYASRLEMARRLMPEAAIGADVMTGFPGETEEEFQETVRFVEEQPFTYLHVFTYSERPGTAAAERGEAVPIPIRRERTRLLREMSEKKNLEFRRQMISQRLRGVTLEQKGWALSSNFLRVRLATERQPNQMADIQIGSIVQDGLAERSLFQVLQ